MQHSMKTIIGLFLVVCIIGSLGIFLSMKGTYPMKTYTNHIYGFQVSYPKTWTQDHNPDESSFLLVLQSGLDSDIIYGAAAPPKTFLYSFYLSHIPNPDHKTIDSLLLDQYGVTVNIRKQFIKNNEFLKSTDVPSMNGELHYYFQLPEGSYVDFTLFPFSQVSYYKNQQEAEELFIKILSSFRLIK